VSSTSAISVSVCYHNVLRRAAGVAATELSLPRGSSVRDALEALSTASTDALCSLLFTAEGSIVPYLVVFRNHKLVTHDQFDDTELADGDELKLFPAVSGG